MGRKSPKKAFNRLFHTLCLKYHSVGTASVLLLLVFLLIHRKQRRRASRLATEQLWPLEM